MRRITLILSDLYLPEDAERDIPMPAAMPLPNFDWLLRFARLRGKVLNWRAWLAARLGCTELSRLPTARAAARGVLPAELAATAWFATPALFELRIDHVRLTDRGMLRIFEDERASWCEQFARDFGPEYRLHEGGPRGFFLTGLAPTRAAPIDPARVLGSDIAKALGSVRAGLENFRLSTEIELWLHASPLNLARERARRPRISSMWLWGGNDPEGDIPPVEGRQSPQRPELLGEDPLLASLARELAVAPPRAAPDAFDLVAADATAIVELSPMSGEQRHALPLLDSRWFAPLRSALEQGELAALDIVVNDRWFEITARSSWRFWRRGRGWLTTLKA